MNYPDKEAPAGGAGAARGVGGPAGRLQGRQDVHLHDQSGFKFSNGQPVTAASFKRAVDRLDSPKMASSTSFLTSDIIVGAQDELNGKTSSISGVIARGNKLTIKLIHPPRTCWHGWRRRRSERSTRRWPRTATRRASNTYAELRPVLLRGPHAEPLDHAQANPNYKGSRPHNAARIQVNVGNSPDVIYQNVVKGTTDYAEDGITPTLYAGVAKKYGINKKQFFIRPSSRSTTSRLNHDPGQLFNNNPQLAKAVNYAVDRHAYIAQRGFLAGARTNRILPPGMAGVTKKTEVLKSGYPIKRHGGGRRPGEEARRRPHGQRQGRDVGAELGPGPLQAQIVQYDLKQIGINVSIKLLPRAQQFTTARNRSQATYDINWSAWGADYNDPFDFINILLDGKSIGPTANNNDAYYNNPKFNAEMPGRRCCSGTSATRRTTASTGR